MEIKKELIVEILRYLETRPLGEILGLYTALRLEVEANDKPK